MPRMACMETGRPVVAYGGGRPIGPLEWEARYSWPKAASASSAAIRRIVSRRDAGTLGNRLGRVSRVRGSARRGNGRPGTALRPSGQLTSPPKAGLASTVGRAARAPARRRSQAIAGRRSSSRMNRPYSGCPRRPRPASGRWCSERRTRDRFCPSATARGPAPERTNHPFRDGCRPTRRRSPNSRCARD